MQTHLDRIMACTRVRVDERKSVTDLADLERRAQVHEPRGFIKGLRAASTRGPAIIAELKKASPSKGLLRGNFQPAAIGQAFAEAGAAAISVLTDEDFFQGSLDHLAAVSQAVSIPVLRKDFILDSFQILEARSAGADAILLIVAAHADQDLRSLSDAAHAIGLEVLCEVHDREELKRAVDLGFDLIGVNCRNLKTLHVDPTTHFELAKWMPPEVLRVAESGIGNAADVQTLLGAGYHAFLIGETLMREQDPAAKLATLLGANISLGVR